MAFASTYSFLDVQCGITGPGGTFSLGSDAGAAEEGITIAFAEPKNTMTTGAGGDVMHSLHAGRTGMITVRLLKTSPVNRQLSVLYNFQTTSAAYHGRNTISMRNPVTGDTFTLSACAFQKFPDNVNGKDGGTNEWTFDCGFIDPLLGSGTPVLVA